MAAEGVTGGAVEGGGDRAEFDDLFCEMLPRLYRRAVALTSSAEAAEEALQEIYLKLASRPERLLSHPQPYGYAIAALVNVVRDGWRRRRREVPVADPSDLMARSWDGGVRLREAQLQTLWLLAQLTPRQAGVVLLVDVDGYTLDQAAEVLGLHRGTVALTRTRALRKLRRLLTRREQPASGGPR